MALFQHVALLQYVALLQHVALLQYVALLQHVVPLQHVVSVQHVAMGLKCFGPSSGGARRAGCGRTGTRTGWAWSGHVPGPSWALSEVG